MILPATMMAIEIKKAGGPEVLVPVQRPTPAPGAGEVLVKVRAAGVNRPDIMQRMGMYPPPPGASDIPGLEIAGEVVAQGQDVVSPAVGETVCALVTGGGYAQYCVAASALCLPLPCGTSFIEAAALPETYFTVWTNVFERGRLRAGETLLVHGGSSGIGTTAIQLAVSLGGRVYVTAGNDEKCRACEQLGAEAAINYRNADFVSEIDELTDGRGVDVILDMVGGDYLPRNLRCLAVEGRLVQIALQHGPKAQMNLLPIMLNRLTVTGSTLRPRSVEQKALIAEALREQVWPFLETKRIRSVVHRSFSFERAPDAHRMMEESTHIGKLVLSLDT